MVVKFKIDLADLDLGHLALFVGLRVNELVIAELTRLGFRHVRESHGYVIQHLIESERSITELARRMEVTQQAASKTVAELVRLGILEESPAEDRRAKRIRLSQQGWKGVHAARRIRAALNRKLKRVLGGREYERSKHALIGCIEELGGTRMIKQRRLRQPR